MKLEGEGARVGGEVVAIDAGICFFQNAIDPPHFICNKMVF